MGRHLKLGEEKRTDTFQDWVGHHNLEIPTKVLRINMTKRQLNMVQHALTQFILCNQFNNSKYNIL